MDKEFNEFKKGFNKLRNENIYSECIHKDSKCSDNIVKAHSIQNNRILNKLSKNGEVLQFSLDNISEVGIFNLKKVGRKKATTFTGFCGYHDKELFKPIEDKDYIPGDIKQEFIFAYRTIAKEYHSKKTSINIYTKLLQMTEKNDMEAMQKYFTNINNESMQMLKLTAESFIEGLDMSLKDLEKYNTAMKINLSRKRYNKVETKVIEFDEEYSLAVSSTFYMTNDLEGNIINDLSNLKATMIPTMLTVIPQNGKTYILISYFSKDRERFRFINEQILNKSKDEQKIIISNLIIQYCENFVFSPSKWETMDENEQKNIVAGFNDISSNIYVSQINSKYNLFI